MTDLKDIDLSMAKQKSAGDSAPAKPKEKKENVFSFLTDYLKELKKEQGIDQEDEEEEEPVIDLSKGIEVLREKKKRRKTAATPDRLTGRLNSLMESEEGEQTSTI